MSRAVGASRLASIRDGPFDRAREAGPTEQTHWRTVDMANPPKLKKSLKLFDVYAISTGAMFSSGFFLLPGIAFMWAGPSVFLAYLLAAVAAAPAMFSKAELATAMPRAGGTYYFLDRSLGPLAGTVAGLGAWFGLILKTAFALVGFGAYLALVLDVSIRPVAVGLAFLFLVLNILGAKESSLVQRVLVTVLVMILAAFVIEGLLSLGETGVDIRRDRLTPFAPQGSYGLISAVGLVFVSYAGLTKVASVAEEVQNPDRNLPLGMILSLVTATTLYVLGVFVMIAVLPPETLAGNLTPVAAAVEVFVHWMPGNWELWLVLLAAFAAFASTANAGIMSAARYLLAMGRDHLVPEAFAAIGRFRTPTFATVVTGLITILAVVTLDVEGLAKLASSFQLLLFALINLAVIVMRESRIESYDPGYRAPGYPLVQIAGFLIPVGLILQMGWLALGFTAGVIGVSIMWYVLYAHQRLVREGAILHVFARLGQQRDEDLDLEFRMMLKDMGLRESDSFDEVVSHALVEDVPGLIGFEHLTARAATHLEHVVGVEAGELERRFLEGSRVGMTPVSHGAALPHLRIPGIDRPWLFAARCAGGVRMEDSGLPDTAALAPVQAVFFLVSPEGDTGRHLRILARIASRVDDTQFLNDWLSARNEQELKEALIRRDRLCSLPIARGTATEPLIGVALREAPLHDGVLVALVSRSADVIVPTGTTILEEGDRLTIIGSPGAVARIRSRYDCI